MSTRRNNYFVDAHGISREVITADICKYLDRDATVRPGIHNGREGYIITAYRNLTSAQVEDLRNDSAKWEEERRRGEGTRRAQAAPPVGLVASYAHSQTRLASNNPYGPSVPSPVQTNSSGYPTPSRVYAAPPQDPLLQQRDYRAATHARYNQEAKYVPAGGPPSYPPSVPSGYAGQSSVPGYGRDARSAQHYEYNSYSEPGYGPQPPYSPPRSSDSQYAPQVRSYAPQGPPQSQHRAHQPPLPPSYAHYPSQSGHAPRYGDRR